MTNHEKAKRLAKKVEDLIYDAHAKKSHNMDQITAFIEKELDAFENESEDKKVFLTAPWSQQEPGIDY